MLMPAIAEILGGAERGVRAIIAVRGPGSYAGIRVGLATAGALALAFDVPLVGVGTFEAVASLAMDGDWLAIHPVGRGTFAAQAVRGGLVVGPLASERGETLAAHPARLLGEGAATFGGRETDPVARVIAALTLGEARLSASALAPAEAIYLREPNISTPRRPIAPRQTH